MSENEYGLTYWFWVFLSVANFVLVAIEVFVWANMGLAILQALVGLCCIYGVQYMRTHYFPVENSDTDTEGSD